MSKPDTSTQETTNKDAGSSDLATICIDLETVHAQTELEEKDLIQKHVYIALKERIRKRLGWVQKKTSPNQNQCETSRIMPSGSGWVSFIDGTRGAGKSTFMHNTLRLLDKDKVNRPGFRGGQLV